MQSFKYFLKPNILILGVLITLYATLDACTNLPIVKFIEDCNILLPNTEI